MSGDDSFGRTKQVGDAAQSILTDLASRTNREALKFHPGKGVTNLGLGMYRLQAYAAALGVSAQGIEALEETAVAQFSKGTMLCESPIERSMLAGLITGNWTGFESIPPLVHDGRSSSTEMLPEADIVIVPQMAFLRFRLDFGVVAMREGGRRIVAVECDGAAYHRDADLERYRVNYLKSWGIPVFKFSGKLLHEDAIEAADVVINAICRWRIGE